MPAATQRRLMRLGRAAAWVALGVSLVMLIEAPTIMAAAGGMVSYYLVVIVVALFPLGWADQQLAKIGAGAVILIAVIFAHRDHKAGIAYQERVLRVKLHAELRQAGSGQAADSGAQASPMPSTGP